MVASPKQWQQVAWDGVRFPVPPDWQPSVVLENYLLFEHDGEPVCEIKWQQGRSSFEPDRVLKRFRKTLGPDVTVNNWILPDTWPDHCPSFTVSGFRLHQPENQSFGILTHCPVCLRTTLLRFHDDPTGIDETVRNILASLADHCDGPEQSWSIFDVQALLPTEAKLVSHEFLPGRFTLRFKREGTIISLYRFRPAAVILKKQNLVEFGRSLNGQGQTCLEEEHQVRFADQAAGLERLRRRLRRKPVQHWFQLRHLPEHNVILGVQGEATDNLDQEMLERVCAGFTITTHQQQPA